MTQPAVKHAKTESGKVERFGRILLVDTASDDSALGSASRRAKIQVGHSLRQGCKLVGESLPDLVIAGPRLGTVNWQRIVEQANDQQSASPAFLSPLGSLYEAKDASELLARLVAIAATFTDPQQTFALLCDGVTREPHIESLHAQPACPPNLSCVLRSYTDAPGTVRDTDPHLWMIPVVHDSRLEGMLGMVCPRQPDEGFGRKLETLHQLSRLSAPLFAGVRDVQQLRRTVDGLEAVLQIHIHLMSNVCHEIRSTLAAVRGYAKRMLDERSGPISEAQRDNLTVIQRNTSTLRDLVSYTLPFIAEERLRVESFDLRETWQSTFNRARIRLSEKSIAVRKQIPADPLIVMADRQRLAAALEIILANAIRCAPNDGEITVRLTRGANREVTVRVAVTGTMLPRQFLDSIFEHQAESPPPAVDPDIVRLAGLPLANDLVWLNGGRLAVRSTAGEGTLFSITLPPPLNQ